MDTLLLGPAVGVQGVQLRGPARGGRVMLNGKVAKAGAEVKPGDVIELSFGQRSLRVEVVSVSESAAKADAPAMYRELA